jgi:hypothetical protein
MDMPRNTLEHAIARGPSPIGPWCSPGNPIAADALANRCKGRT